MKDEASQVYAEQVAELIAANPRESSWAPAQPVELFVRRRRQPTSLEEIEPIERQQIERMFPGQDLAALLSGNALRDDELEEDFPLDLEVAVVVDAEGAPRYRLYGMNYGCIYLMAADSLTCVAFAAQHDLEHWHADQRPIFWAMDRAMRRHDHGFQQPLKFCWWHEPCWEEIVDAERGTVGSEPYLRQQFAGDPPP